MDFLVKFFEARVNKIGTIEDKERMAKAISEWKDAKTHTVEEGIQTASEEAVVEEESEVTVVAKDLLKELADEIAMNSRKSKNGNKKAAQAQKELMQFRSKLQGKSDLEIVQMFNKKLQTV